MFNPNVLWDQSYTKEKNEWYTPSHIIELVKQCLDEIDLDPASCLEANKQVNAKKYFTIEDDALEQSWDCKTLYMNPPYSNGNITKFTNKFLYELPCIDEAIILVASFPETNWCQKFLIKCNALCFIKGRVGFKNSNKVITQMPRWGNIIFYFGNQPKKFCRIFNKLGKCFLNTV